jgi:hypothetical protein
MLVVGLAPGIARAAGPISGTVTKLETCSPEPGCKAVAGAVVTVAGPGQTPATATTDAAGRYSRPVDGSGPFSVGVQAEGFAGQSVGGVPAAGPAVDFALGPAEFTPLPVFAGGAAAAADATSGIFYAIAGFAPEVYRSVDYGGSWRPVTMSYDDPGDGLRTTVQKDTIRTSSVSGEVAILQPGGPPPAAGSITFSTDYGLTWRTVGGDAPTATGPGRRLFWAHASPGAPSVLVVAQPREDGGWDLWRADMSAAAPALVKEPADPFGVGSVIAVADSASGSFVGRVSASGELSFAPLTASGPIAFDTPEASGLPAPPLAFALGGAKEPSAPPDGALVAGGNGPYSAVMLTKDAGAARFSAGSASAPTDLSAGGDCGFSRPPRDASVAPTSSGSSGAATAKFCWLQKNGTDPLTVFSNAGVGVYDARWGQPPPDGNFVAFRAGFKSARLDANGVPDFDSGEAADPGTDPNSGGLSVNGITSPDVRDAVYGPPGASDVAVALTDLILASKNGGTELKQLLPRGQGSRAVAWWQGSGRTWLVFGHANCTRMLTAFVNWDVTSPVLAEPNVNGSSCADLGGAEAGGPPGETYQVRALEAVPGTDMVFIALGAGQDPQGGGGINHLYRATLQPGDGSNPPSLVELVNLDPPAGAPFEPGALDFCPTSAAYPEEGGVLFATGGPPPDVGGSLLRITGAAGPNPAVTAVSSVAGTADVRADCATGVVYVGGSGGPGGGTFSKSTDGGRTFLPIPAGGPGPITAIGLNPADPADVKTAIAGGTIFHSADGGSLWTLVNDPTVDRPMNVHDIEYPPGGGPGAPGLPRLAALTPPARALVATGSGVFHGALAANSGVLAVRGAGRPVAGAQISDLTSDDQPTLALPRAGGAATTVFRRSNGLYQSTSVSPGSWSLPELIPGTTAADGFPVTAFDGAGRLHLAFVRRGNARGIHVMSREPTGAWSAAKRVSSGVGDTLPALAVSGSGRPSIDVAFLRTRGRPRGVYHASGRGARWRRASRVRGTTAADARAVLGGPSLDARGRRLHLAFARAGRAPGIVYALRAGSRWTSPRRLTTVRGDSQPSLVLASRGLPQIAFRRTTGRRRRGLLVLRGGRRWTLRHVPGTNARDTEPALSAAGSGLFLAFARPAGTEPGVYYDRSGRSGRWLREPGKWSGGLSDRNPAVRADGTGLLTIVFERG